MMGDEILVSLNDPRQVTDAQLLAITQRNRDRHPRRVAKRFGLCRRPLGRAGVDPVRAQAFGAREV
jgi:hypothetical protein